MLSLSGDTTLLPEDLTMLANPHVGGIILFSRNYSGSSYALRQLVAAIRRAAGRELLIVTDHEGGRVQRFRGDEFTTIPPMAQVAAADNALAMTRAAGIVIAAELLAHGVDMTFAPVLDLDYGVSEVIGDRAFAADADTAATLALSFCAGMAAAGMPSCAKHFPGHGYVAADSHHELPVDERTAEQVMADAKPFARFAEAGEASFMTAHIIFNQIDKQPVTFSSHWLKTILRDEMGYKGLVVSDDLCMQGAAAIGDIGARMQAAAAAGCDLLLVCQPQDNAAALAAMDSIKGGAAWQQLLRHDTNRITVGDDAYRLARQQLAALQ